MNPFKTSEGRQGGFKKRESKPSAKDSIKNKDAVKVKEEVVIVDAPPPEKNCWKVRTSQFGENQLDTKEMKHGNNEEKEKMNKNEIITVEPETITTNQRQEPTKLANNGAEASDGEL